MTQTTPSNRGATPPPARTPKQRSKGPRTEPPPQAVMGLLNYITATSLDEDYAHVAERGARDPRRPGTIGLVVLAVFGVLVATAALQTSRNADESASSRSSLVEQVKARKAVLVKERDHVVDLQRSVAALRDDNLDARTQGRAVQSQLSRLGIATGSVVTRGPGIEVVVDDAPGATSQKQQVHGQDLQRLVNGLWEVGAEAISINGQRLNSLSPIRDAASAITVNFVSLRRPYTISAVGNRQQMGARLLDTAGGQTWVSLESTFGLQFDVVTEENMKLPAADRATLRSAHQPERLK